jgi:hypothetical protein
MVKCLNQRQLTIAAYGLKKMGFSAKPSLARRAIGNAIAANTKISATRALSVTNAAWK